MKASITSTTAIVEIKDLRGRIHAARVWEGVTEAGIPFTAYITTVMVARQHDQSAFERELVEQVQPSAETKRAIDQRFII